MNKNIISVFRWPLIMGYLGIVALMMACLGTAVGSSGVEQGILQLDDGIIKVQNQDGDWVPVAGNSTFELVGSLEGIDPWMVAGKALVTNESTQIADGLQIGDSVRVQGAILDDDTWLAYSVEPAEEQTDRTITIIGRATSVDPWVVNEINLNVTEDTIIEGEITPGMLVRVEILLLEDGTWETISITPIDDLPPTSGCATVTATVVSVNGNEIQFLGWPTTVTVEDNTQTDNDNNENDDDENGNENDGDENVEIITVAPGQQVLAVICVSDDGQLVIVQITVIDEDDDNAASEGGEKVLVCHKPDKKGGHTLSIAAPAVPAHLGHGDTLGACP